MIRKLLLLVRSFFLFFFNSSKERSLAPGLRLLCLGMFFVVTAFGQIFGQTRYAVVNNGNWNSASTWSATSGGGGGATVPGAGSTVIIERGLTVVVNATGIQCGSLQLGGSATTSTAGTLTFATTGSPSLSVSGDIQIGTTGSTARVGTITFVSGATLSGSNIIFGSTGAGRGVVTMTAGSVLNANSFVVNTTATASTWTPSTGTVNMTANNNLPNTVVTSFNNLTISSGTTTTMTIPLTASGTVNILGTLNTNNNNLSIAGDFISTGTFNPGTNTVTLSGANQSFNVANFNNLAFTGSGTKTFTSTVPTVISNNISIPMGILASLGSGLTHTAGSLTLGGTGQTPGTYGSTASGAANRPAASFGATGSSILSISCNTGNWTGATSTDWSVATNWCGGVPTTTTDVTIPSGVPNQPTIPVAVTATVRTLNINNGATLTMSNNANSVLQISGNFNNNGTFTGTASNTVSFVGTANQNIAGFTAGNISMLKTGGTATLTGSLTSSNPLVINGTGGILNLGVGYTHTFPSVTLTAGTLNGGSSILALSAAAPFTGAATFTPATGTVTLNGTAQSTVFSNFYNLTLSGSGTKTFTVATTIANTLTISSTSVKASLQGFDHTAIALILGTSTKTAGAYGGTGALPSGTTTVDTNYFNNGTGKVTISTDSCLSFAVVAPITKVTFNTLNNSSSAVSATAPAYELFAASGAATTTVVKGQSYGLVVSGNTNGDVNVYYTALFDWNGNGSFADAGDGNEQIGTLRNSSGSDGKSTSGYILIPTTATTGTVKIRIIAQVGSYAGTGCTTNTNTGQIEDYTITLQAGCSGSAGPTAGTTASTASTVCPNVPFTLSAGTSPAITDGATYLWQTSPDNATWSSAPTMPTTFFTNDFSVAQSPNTTAGNISLYGNDTSITGGELFLTQLNGGYLGGFVIQATPGTSVNAFTATFDYKIYGGGGADGMSLSYAGNITNGAGGGESGEGSGIILQLDTYDNEGVTPGSRIRILYNGVTLFNAAIDKPFNLRTTSTTSNNVVMSVDNLGRLSLSIKGTVIVSNLALPATYLSDDKSNWKFKFAGRTGGTTDIHSIDNVTIKYLDVTNTGPTFTTSQTTPTYYRVMVTCGGSTPWASTFVNMTSAAVTDMTAPTCSASAFTVTPVNVTNGRVPSGTTYTWPIPVMTSGVTGGAASTGTPASIIGTLTNSTAAPLTATYTVTPTTAGCTGPTFTLIVTVNPKAAITAMTTSACSGSGFTQTPANTTNGIVPTGTTYSWALPSVTGGLTGGATGSGASSITGTLTNPTNTAQTATYTITPSSGGCTGATFTVTVTVNPTPGITAMTTSACSGSGFTQTPANTTNGIVPTGTTYSWALPSVTGGLTGGATGSGASSITGTLINPTNAAQTATYTVTPVSGGCTGATFTVTVTVNPTPGITAMTTSACSGSGFTQTPANTINGIVPTGTTYSWALPSVTGGLTGGATGSGASSITGTLTNPTNTAQTATYTVTPVSGGCTGATFTVTVTVNPTPGITAMTTSACSGSGFTQTPANTINGIVPTGTTYSWALPSVTGGLTGGATGSGASSITGTLTNPTNTAQTATYTVTPVSGGCTGATFTVTVTVNPTPGITAMTTSACSGSGFTQTPANTTNGIVPTGTTYSWALPSVTGGLTGGATGSGVSSITGTLTNPTNTAQTATYTVTPVSGGCTGATFTVTVTVNPKAAITAMTTSACSGSGFTQTPANTTNGIVPTGTTYSWALPSVTGGLTGGATGSGASSITGTLTNPTNTAQTATYTVTPVSGGCTGATFTVTVTVNPTPGITAMTTSACSGSGFTQTPANTTNGIVPTGTTYSWALPSVTGGLTGGATGSGASSITGTLTNPTNAAQTATYTVTPVSGGCTGATFTVTVTVNPTPGITAMTTSACSGSGFTQTPANTTNGIVPTGTTYSWALPSVTGGLTGGATGSGASSITGTLTNPTNTAQTATYTVTPVSGGCTGATFTVTVTVNSKAAITAMTTSACSGSGFTQTPANTTNGIVPTGTTYSWALPSVTGGLTGGATGSGASSITGTLTNPTNTAQTATYTVTPVSGGCTGATFTVTVTVNPTPGITAMTTSACSGSGFTQTPANPTNGIVPTGTTYSWALPSVTGGLTGGATGSGASSITGTLTNPTNTAQTATYTVTPVSGGCTGATFTVTVTVNPKAAITAMTTSACSGSGFTQTPANTTNGIVPTGTTYSWALPSVTGGLTGGATGSGASSITGTLTNSTNTAQTATYTVTPSSGGCTGATFTVTVTVNPTPGITAMTTSACSGSGFTQTPANTTNGIVPTGTTYSWALPSVTGGLTGGATGSGASSITGTLTNPTNAAQTATYTVTPVSGGCTGVTFTVTVTVNPTPGITAMTTSACSGSGFTQTPANTTNGIVPTGTTYSWALPSVTGGLTGGATGSGASSITGTLTNPTSIAQTATYTVTPTSGGCTGATFTVTVTVNPTPSTPTASVTTQPTCAIPTGVITITSPAPASGISYSIDGTDYTNTSGVFTGVAINSYNVTVKNSTGCISLPTSVTVNPPASKTWTGATDSNWNVAGNWTPSGVPTATDCVVIPDLTLITNKPAITGTNGNFSAFTLTVRDKASLNVGATNTIKVEDAVTVIGTGDLTFENESSLLQTNTGTNINTGNISYKRDTAPVRRYDITYWSTPVTSATYTLHDLSPNTLGDKYYTYDPTNGFIINYNGTSTMTSGVGYLVRAPQPYDINTPAVYNAKFSGVPTNGDVSVTPQNGKWNLIGNPYPSAIDADELIGNNSTGALYFWTHNTKPSSALPGDGKYNYTSADYAIYSLTGSISTSGATSVTGYKAPPTGKIAAAQSFFMKASSGNPILFTNHMRIANNNDQFFKTTKTSELEKNRLWINLTNAEGIFKQALVGYIEGATNNWDLNYDAATINGNEYADFYSISDATKLAVQGRALPFANTDLVPLGYRTTVAGDFTISIDHADGLFSNQKVYLEDKTTGTVYDLTAGDYTFTTAIGTFTDRFTLRYTNKTLGTGDFENLKNTVLVSIKDKAIKVTSTQESIKEVSIYDVTGKLLYNKKKVSSTELQILNLQSSNQALVVKVILDNDYSTIKKIIFQ